MAADFLRTRSFRFITVLTFVLACAVFFLYMWSQSGGTVPGLSKQRPYGVSVIVDDVGNLVPFSDIQEAGVDVGKVESMTRQSGGVRLDLKLDGPARPLHDGARLQVSEKSLGGQPVLTLIDGVGKPFRNGAELPRSAVKPSVQLRDVLASLDGPTRDALGSTIRSLGEGTRGRSGDLSRAISGLAKLGRSGHTALGAISAQTTDLKALTRELNTMLTALDTGQGRIAEVVEDANKLSGVTAGQRQAVEGTVSRLPGVLQRVQVASGRLTGLADSLAPVAADLKTAGPDLSSALQELPATTNDLRGLLPSLDGALIKAPATLDAVPPVGSDLRALIPQAREVLRDLNPSLRYLEPYGKDIMGFFQNFGASLHHYAAPGEAYHRFRPVIGPYSLRPNPVPLEQLMKQNNPYPAPGGLRNPTGFDGNFPRLERDPK